jgi:hypothetical protein
MRTTETTRQETRRPRASPPRTWRRACRPQTSGSTATRSARRPRPPTPPDTRPGSQTATPDLWRSRTSTGVSSTGPRGAKIKVRWPCRSRTSTASWRRLRWSQRRSTRRCRRRRGRSCRPCLQSGSETHR